MEQSTKELRETIRMKEERVDRLHGPERKLEQEELDELKRELKKLEQNTDLKY
ncbi:MAG: hypothetical protein ACRD50_01285 [Candidatus Acidiferrales bacterium]